MKGRSYLLPIVGASLATIVAAVMVPSSSDARVARAAMPPTTVTTTSLPAEEPSVAEPSALVDVEPATTTTAPLYVPPPPPWRLMLIGDSMAYTAGLGLAPHALAFEFSLANEGINGCGVVRGGPYRYFGRQHDVEARCESWPAAWAEAVARNQPQLVAIVVGRWELMDRVHDGHWTNVFDPAFVAYVESELEAAVDLAAAGGARVALFTTPYYLRGTTADGGRFPEDDPARVDIVNALIRRVGERKGVAVVDVGAMLAPGGTYTREIAGVRVRSDGVHLTRQAGDVLAPQLFPQLRELLLRPPVAVAPT